MATDHSLRFSLKESVWFQKGQEVEELLSISLDPDVEIEELEHEVIVRGQLDLTGEYIAKKEESEFSTSELSPAKSIDYVEEREDGIHELVHSFPLEISIPRNRVKVIEELYVSIEEFDYELKENGCLQLLADISIYGLNDVGRELDDEEELESEDTNGKREEGIEAVEEEKELEEPEETAEIILQSESNGWQDYAFEPFQLEERKEQELIEEEELEEHDVEDRDKEEMMPQVELFGRTGFKEKETKKETEEQEEPVYSQRDENALYLTKLFTKEAEEEFTKVRMYFVQEGDTIESVAERYETSVQHLHRINRTDDIYLTAGQVIYIPVPKAKSK